MELTFVKYQGTGNDFVMIDNSTLQYEPLTISQIQHICSRRFGVGADGLILIEQGNGVDFTMNYYNADGSQSFCGNGGRCAVAFAYQLGLISSECKFRAIDGIHYAAVLANNRIKLRMGEISAIERIEQDYYIHTGSPHYIRFTDSNDLDIVDFGRTIRYNQRFKDEGTNVNIARPQKNHIEVQTYERGVEDETYSCGTGVTAVALVHASTLAENEGTTCIQTKGGELNVYWKKQNGMFTEVYLEGPATLVYEGKINI